MYTYILYTRTFKQTHTYMYISVHVLNMLYVFFRQKTISTCSYGLHECMYSIKLLDDQYYRQRSMYQIQCYVLVLGLHVYTLCTFSYSSAMLPTFCTSMSCTLHVCMQYYIHVCTYMWYAYNYFTFIHVCIMCVYVCTRVHCSLSFGVVVYMYVFFYFVCVCTHVHDIVCICHVYFWSRIKQTAHWVAVKE